MAELLVGPHAAADEIDRQRRRRHCRWIEQRVEVLPFDAECARAYDSVYVAVSRVGRKPWGARAIDLMIAATALAHGLALYTLNPKDLRGLEGQIEIVALGSAS